MPYFCKLIFLDLSIWPMATLKSRKCDSERTVYGRSREPGSRHHSHLWKLPASSSLAFTLILVMLVAICWTEAANAVKSVKNSKVSPALFSCTVQLVHSDENEGHSLRWGVTGLWRGHFASAYRLLAFTVQRATRRAEKAISAWRSFLVI